MNISNQTALVTGATSGLGKLISQELAKNSLNVIISGRNKEKLETQLNEIKTIYPQGEHSYILCDLNKPHEIKDKFADIKKLDILVNCAGLWTEGNTIDISQDRIIELVNVNLASYLLIFRTVLPKLLESEYAQMLNVVSVAGYEIPAGFFHTIYSATKYGLQGFSEATAKEFEGKNLRVMALYPGGMETEFFKNAQMDYKTHEDWMFDPKESVEAIMFMLTRNKKVSVKRLDIINHIFE